MLTQTPVDGEIEVIAGPDGWVTSVPTVVTGSVAWDLRTLTQSTVIEVLLASVTRKCM